MSKQATEKRALIRHRKHLQESLASAAAQNFPSDVIEFYQKELANTNDLLNTKFPPNEN